MGTPSTTKHTSLLSQSNADVLAMYASLARGNIYFVDGTNGSDSNSGLDCWSNAKATIQAAVTAASAFDTIFIGAIAMAAGASDPGNYAETIIIPATHEGLQLIGVSRGRTQGGLPQIKKGSGTTALLTVRAPGCLIKNLGFNGIRSTGATQSLVGILLDDDSGSAQTKSAFGTTIEGCHFKNCAGANSSTDAAAGGAITWSALGGAWQVLIKGCRFYKNVGDIVLLGTGDSRPQDVIIEDCIFAGPAANVDSHLYLAGGDGMAHVVIKNCTFGQLPSLGTQARYMVLTGCTGMLVDCTFGCQTSGTGGTRITFLANGTGAKIPTTVHIARCFGQSITADATGGEISIG